MINVVNSLLGTGPKDSQHHSEPHHTLVLSDGHSIHVHNQVKRRASAWSVFASYMDRCLDCCLLQVVPDTCAVHVVTAPLLNVLYMYVYCAFQGKSELHFVLVGGQPIGEPVVQHGR